MLVAMSLASPGATRLLRRRLSTLVLRDAIDAYWVGAVLLLMPLVYLFREWPPWAIRDAIVQLSVADRAGLCAGAHVIHALVTAPVVHRLIASDRLRWWWSLPVSTGWWRRLHLRHLVLLDAPWLAIIAYGVAPSTHAVLVAVTFMALTLAVQVALVTGIDRTAWWRGACLAGYGAVVAAAVWLPAAVGAGVSVVALGLAILRLGHPIPEPRTRLRGLAGGRPELALARLGWLAARRRKRTAVGWGIGLQLAAVALVGLAIGHGDALEFEALRSLQRGLAVLCASVGSAVVLLAVRVVDGDRPWLDGWGVTPRHERRSRFLLGVMGGLPAVISGLVLLVWSGPAAGWLLADLVVAVAWAAQGMVTMTFALEAGRRLHEPRMLRLLLRIGVAAGLAVGFESVLVLVPWMVLDAARARGVQRRATRTRIRLETAREDDHRV